MKSKFLLLLLFMNITLSGKSQCVSADFYALKDFYTALNGDSWANKTGWDYFQINATPPGNCNLANIFGLTVVNGPSGYYVKAIKLGSNLLAGSLPTSIGNFSLLDTLKLDLNQITGTLPSSIGNLSQLKYLNINGGGQSTLQLSGVIPSSIRNLKNLKYISANYTGFDTPFPSDLALIPGIEVMNFSNAGLSGAISHAMGALINLTSFDFSDNNLSGCFPKSINHWCGVDSISRFQFVNNPGLADWQDHCYNYNNTCPCVSNINLISTANDVSYGVQLIETATSPSTLTASNKLSGGSYTTFQGSGSITLAPGFKAEQGTVFMTALGGGCE